MGASSLTRGESYNMGMVQDGRGWLAVAVVVGAVSCAAQKPAVTGQTGDRSLAKSGWAGDAASSTDDLATAFDSPAANADTREDWARLGRTVSPIPAGDPMGELRSLFSVRIADARRNLASKKTSECGGALDELDPIARKLGPPFEQQIHELRNRLALAVRDFKLATSSAEQWLLSCGPGAPDVCRKRALIAMERAVRQLPKKSLARDRLAKFQENDACFAQSELQVKMGGRIPKCADAARTSYRQLGDHLMVARLFLARARSIESDPGQAAQTSQLLSQAQRACDERRCSDVRRRTLRSQFALEMRLGNAEGAARAALTEMGLASENLAPQRRSYARTSEVDRACEALDRRNGPTTCRRLEKSLLGGYTFHDFSEKTASREGLSADDVRQVNQHFQVLIQDCLAQEAERLEPPASVSYHLRWVALNDGHVDQVRLDRDDQNSGPLSDCLRSQFAFWRYPRYRGEMQHIDQVFSVNTRERRVAIESRR